MQTSGGSSKYIHVRLPGPSIHDNDDVGFHTLLEHFSLVGSQLEGFGQGCACGRSGAIIIHWRIHSKMKKIIKYDAGMSAATFVCGRQCLVVEGNRPEFALTKFAGLF